MQRSAKKIVTFCSDLDKVLGGGIHTGQVTEFCKCMHRPCCCGRLGMQPCLRLHLPRMALINHDVTTWLCWRCVQAACLASARPSLGRLLAC